MAGDAPAAPTAVPPSTPGDGQKEPGTPEPEGNEGESLTKAEVEAMLTTRDAAWQKRMDGQSATIKRLETQLKKNEPAPAPKPTDLDGRVKELEKEAEKIAHQNKIQREREVRHQISKALAEHKLDPAAAERAARLIQLEHGASFFEVSETEDGDLAVNVRESADTVLPVAKWVSLYLQTDQGRFYLPTSRNPQVPGVPAARVAGKRQVTSAQCAKGEVTPEEITKGEVEIIG